MRDSDIDALSADGAQEAQPRTAAGREVDPRYEWDCPSCGAIVWSRYRPPAIEAEAEPAPLDADLLLFVLWRKGWSVVPENGHHRVIHGYEPSQWEHEEAEVVAAEYARLAAGDKGSDR